VPYLGLLRVAVLFEADQNSRRVEHVFRARLPEPILRSRDLFAKALGLSKRLAGNGGCETSAVGHRRTDVAWLLYFPGPIRLLVFDHQAGGFDQHLPVFNQVSVYCFAERSGKMDSGKRLVAEGWVSFVIVPTTRAREPAGRVGERFRRHGI
jgi:hypothetical protein